MGSFITHTRTHTHTERNFVRAIQPRHVAGMGEIRNIGEGVIRKCEGKKLLVISTCSREDNIKMVVIKDMRSVWAGFV